MSEENIRRRAAVATPLAAAVLEAMGSDVPVAVEVRAAVGELALEAARSALAMEAVSTALRSADAEPLIEAAALACNDAPASFRFLHLWADGEPDADRRAILNEIRDRVHRLNVEEMRRQAEERTREAVGGTEPKCVLPGRDLRADLRALASAYYAEFMRAELGPTPTLRERFADAFAQDEVIGRGIADNLSRLVRRESPEQDERLVREAACWVGLRPTLRRVLAQMRDAETDPVCVDFLTRILDQARLPAQAWESGLLVDTASAN